MLEGNNDGDNGWSRRLQQIDGQLEPCHVHKGEGESSDFPDKGDINVRILRSGSFETIRGGKINIGGGKGGNISANLLVEGVRKHTMNSKRIL